MCNLKKWICIYPGELYQSSSGYNFVDVRSVVLLLKIYPGSRMWLLVFWRTRFRMFAKSAKQWWSFHVSQLILSKSTLSCVFRGFARFLSKQGYIFSECFVFSWGKASCLSGACFSEQRWVLLDGLFRLAFAWTDSCQRDRRSVFSAGSPYAWVSGADTELPRLRRLVASVCILLLFGFLTMFLWHNFC